LLINSVFRFDRQLDVAGLAIHIDHHSSDFVANFEHVARVFHAVARNFADAQVADDVFAQIDFSAFGVNSFDLTRDGLAFVVDRHESGEGVRVELLDTQGDALALHVHSQYQGFDFLAFFVFADSVFAGLVPRQVRQVHQTVDASSQSDEHAEVGDGFDRAFDAVAALGVLCEVLPWVGFALLHAEADAALVFVDLEDHDFDFVAQGLGMKQCKANPWQDFAQNTKRGDRVKGPIKSITDFGVFVGLAAGIDGLVHLSDLSWNETGENAVREYKKGQEVEALVLAVDVERERISLGIKQLDSDPFTTFVSVNDKGQTVTGKVKTVDAKGAEIDLGEDIVGYLRVSEISRDRVEDASHVLKVGDEVTAVVVNVDRKTRNIQLSIKAKDAVDQQEAMANLSQQSSRENTGTTSLGALLRAKLDDNNE